MKSEYAGLETHKVGVVLREASQRITQTLQLDKSVGRLEVRMLAAHAWQVSPSWMIAHDTDQLTSLQLAQFETLVERRLRGEPIAYITGKREFFGHVFNVTPDVLIPRPETELLVEIMLAHLPVDQKLDILELGTGSGCIAISLALARPLARITALDKAPAALAIARENARLLKASLQFLTSDWFRALDGQRFDFIVSNPPYVPQQDPHLQRGGVEFEPTHALHSGLDGLHDLRHIIEHATAHLKNEGGLYLEHGYNQAGSVCQLMNINRYTNIRTWQDLSGNDRVTAGFMSK